MTKIKVKDNVDKEQLKNVFKEVMEGLTRSLNNSNIRIIRVNSAFYNEDETPMPKKEPIENIKVIDTMNGMRFGIKDVCNESKRPAVIGDKKYKYDELPTNVASLDRLVNDAGEYAEYNNNLIIRKAGELFFDPFDSDIGEVKVNELTAELNKTNLEKGFGKFADDFLGNIALVHSELSEAVEEYRAGKPLVYFGEDGKPEGVLIELTDAAIRIMNMISSQKGNFENLVLLKNNHNWTRPKLHGKKR